MNIILGFVQTDGVRKSLFELLPYWAVESPLNVNDTWKNLESYTVPSPEDFMGMLVVCGQRVCTMKLL